VEIRKESTCFVNIDTVAKVNPTHDWKVHYRRLKGVEVRRTAGGSLITKRGQWSLAKNLSVSSISK
jgi:hypothetical protein